MHIPRHFVEDDFSTLVNFMSAHPLATIVAQTEQGSEACHIPLFWYDDDTEYGCLYGHFGRQNPIYQNARPNRSWLIIFQDSGHYISPSWYPSKADTHKEVPTWNYQSVHIHSHIQLIEAHDKIVWILTETTANHEKPLPLPWSLTDAPKDYIDALCKGIIGFKLTIGNVEAQFKLNQNKSAENIRGVIEGLTQLHTPSARRMADKLAHLHNDKLF